MEHDAGASTSVTRMRLAVGYSAAWSSTVASPPSRGPNGISGSSSSSKAGLKPPAISGTTSVTGTELHEGRKREGSELG